MTTKKQFLPSMLLKNATKQKFNSSIRSKYPNKIRYLCSVVSIWTRDTGEAVSEGVKGIFQTSRPLLSLLFGKIPLTACEQIFWDS